MKSSVGMMAPNEVSNFEIPNLHSWWCPSLDTEGLNTDTITDLTGNGFNMSLQNITPQEIWVSDSERGGSHALKFDTNGQRSTAGNVWSGGGPITLSVWVKPALPTIGLATIGFVNDPSNRIGGHIPYTGNRIFWDYGNANGAGRIWTQYVGGLEWNNIVCVSEGVGGNYKAIYQDGLLSIEDTGPSDGPNEGLSRPFSFGNALTANGRFTYIGLMDDIRIYDRILTPSEINFLSTSRGIQ